MTIKEDNYQESLGFGTSSGEEAGAFAASLSDMEKPDIGAQKDGMRKRVLWHNLREEPVVYINGRPLVLRDVDKPFSNLEYTGINRDRVEQMESRLKKDILLESSRYGNKILGTDELPDGQMVDQREHVRHESVKTPLEVYEELQAKGYLVDYERLPITDEKSPKEPDFDLLGGIEGKTQVDKVINSSDEDNSDEGGEDKEEGEDKGDKGREDGEEDDGEEGREDEEDEEGGVDGEDEGEEDGEDEGEENGEKDEDEGEEDGEKDEDDCDEGGEDGKAKAETHAAWVINPRERGRFICTACGSSGKYKSHSKVSEMGTHYRLMHKSPQNCCSLCGNRFIKKQHLNQHKKSFH